LIVEQKYIKTKSVTLKTRISNKNKSVNIVKPTNEIDLIQQNNGIVPNIVHSMDASNISILINNLIKSKNNIDISTIHDCFSSQANNVELMSYEVKAAFLHLYRNQKFVNEFHEFILEHIKKLGFILDKTNSFVLLNCNTAVLIPNKPVFDNDFDLKENVLNSQYLLI
jgi:DNA-directed RNA polymerase